MILPANSPIISKNTKTGSKLNCPVKLAITNNSKTAILKNRSGRNLSGFQVLKSFRTVSKIFMAPMNINETVIPEKYDIIKRPVRKVWPL
jgi:hypothetical protein